MNVSKLIPCALLCLCAYISQAQKDLIILGLESSFNYYSSNDLREGAFTTLVGLSAEYPIGQFSFGSGILLVNYGTYDYEDYSGEFILSDEQGFQRKNYINDTYNARSMYVGIPVRVQYRLPCNCAYVQASVETDILASPFESQYVTSIADHSQAGEVDYSDLKKTNARFCLALGFKIHKTEYSRIFMRPEYEYVLNPWTEYNDTLARDSHSFRITMGAQVAIAYNGS